jgi:Fibronectin type III domain
MTAPVLVSQSPSLIGIAWNAPHDGGMSIDSYEVFWDGLNPGSSAFTSLAVVESETLHYSTSSVVAGTSYRFQVSASNLVGDSVASP